MCNFISRETNWRSKIAVKLCDLLSLYNEHRYYLECVGSPCRGLSDLRRGRLCRAWAGSGAGQDSSSHCTNKHNRACTIRLNRNQKHCEEMPIQLPSLFTLQSKSTLQMERIYNKYKYLTFGISLTGGVDTKFLDLLIAGPGPNALLPETFMSQALLAQSFNRSSIALAFYLDYFFCLSPLISYHEIVFIRNDVNTWFLIRLNKKKSIVNCTALCMNLFLPINCQWTSKCVYQSIRAYFYTNLCWILCRLLCFCFIASSDFSP